MAGGQDSAHDRWLFGQHAGKQAAAGAHFDLVK
jgi:hypothetical protein